LNSGDRISVMAVCGEQRASTNFAVNDGLSVETGSDGSWFKLPPVHVAGIYRICWCAAEVLCRYGYEYDVDIGSLLVGGSNAGALYTCYEWHECSIDGFLGTFLSNGDRLRVVPANSGCVAWNGAPINGTSMPIVTGFPLNGLSHPATSGGTVLSWGNTRVRTTPGVYDLCWCSGTLAPGGVCGENGPFNLPAGSIRIGTAKEWDFLNRDAEPEPRSSDSTYAIVLAVTLPVVALLVGVAGWRRISHESARKVNQDPTAVNPFAIVKTTTSKSQEKAKMEYAVKNVRTLRVLALGGLPGQGIFAGKETDVNTIAVFKPHHSPRDSKAQITSAPVASGASKLRALGDLPSNKEFNSLLNRAHTAVTLGIEDQSPQLPGRPQIPPSPTMSMGMATAASKTPKATEEEEYNDDPRIPTIEAPVMHLRPAIRDVLGLPALADDDRGGGFPWNR